MQIAQVCCNRGWLILAVLTATVVHAESGMGGSLSLTSEYAFRGIALSGEQAALQGDLHWRGKDGSMAGIWVSKSRRVVGYQASLEVDGYLSQSFQLTDPWTAQVGYVRYTYPEARHILNYDYDEFHAALSYSDRASLSIAFSPDITQYTTHGPVKNSRWFAYQLNLRQSLASNWALSAGLGDFVLRGVVDATYLAWNAGVDWHPGVTQLAVNYIGVNRSGRTLYGSHAINGRLVASASWRF